MTVSPDRQRYAEGEVPTPVFERAQCAIGDSLLIFFGGMLVFTFALSPELVGLQVRFGLFAQEMLRQGPTFFPTTYHSPYPDYPATSTLLIYLASLPIGQVTPLTAVFPTAAVSSLILVVTYRIGAMRSRTRGLAAVLLALLTVEFLSASRSIAIDQYTSLATVLSFYIVYSADDLNRRTRLWLLAPIWIFGFAFRGPIGLVLPAAVACSYYLWHQRWRPLALAAMSAAITLGVCLAGLLAAAKMEGGEAFAQTVLQAQMTGRMRGSGAPTIYYWYDCFTSYALAYPLAVVLVVGRAKEILQRSSEDDALLGSLAAWTLVVLAVMSIPAAKKTRYVLSIVPAISLMASYLLVEMSPRLILSRIRRLFLDLCLSLPAGMAVTVLAAFLFVKWTEPAWTAHFFSTLAVLVLLAVLSVKSHRRGMDDPTSVLASLAIAVAAFIAAYIGIFDPIHWSQEQTRPFVSQVEALCEKDPGTLVFFRVDPDGDGIKFMVNLSQPLPIRFLDSLDELRELPGMPYIVMKDQVFRTLPTGGTKQMTVIGRGKIGHRDFVILTLEKEAQEQTNGKDSPPGRGLPQAMCFA